MSLKFKPHHSILTNKTLCCVWFCLYDILEMTLWNQKPDKWLPRVKVGRWEERANITRKSLWLWKGACWDWRCLHLHCDAGYVKTHMNQNFRHVNTHSWKMKTTACCVATTWIITLYCILQSVINEEIGNMVLIPSDSIIIMTNNKVF